MARAGPNHGGQSLGVGPDGLSNTVFANAPCEGNPDTRNDADRIFGQSDGTTMLQPEQSGDGYSATFSIALAVS